MEVDSGDTGLHVYKSGNMISNICVPIGVILSLILNVIVLLGVGKNNKDVADFKTDHMASTGDKDAIINALSTMKSQNSNQIIALQNTLQAKIDKMVTDTAASTKTIGDKKILGKYALNNKQIVIGVDPEWPPYCFTDNSKAKANNDPSQWEEPQGFLLDVTREACKLQGLDCLFQLYTNYQECWTKDHSIGRYLENGIYDMCLCWTVTPQRTRRIIFPNNDAIGFTKKPTAGFLVLSKTKTENAAEWKRLRAVFDGDTCTGTTMVQALKDDGSGGAWYDDCDKDTVAGKDRKDATLKEKCTKTCADGKIRVGLIKGWATNGETFNWIKNAYTNSLFDLSRIVFVDEQSTRSDGHISTYNHIAQELENGHIDVGYVPDNVINEMSNAECTICKGHDLWTSGGLTIHNFGNTVQENQAFAIGGASGFFRFDQAHVRDAITEGANKYMAMKDKYCPTCLQYWKRESECNKFCLGCGTDKPDGGVDYCSTQGQKG